MAEPSTGLLFLKISWQTNSPSVEVTQYNVTALLNKLTTESSVNTGQLNKTKFV